MPLDEYKTQVLLLHSEQSTLDNLSSGFNDRYTVHCATSGSEALNTLVDTPINVIITAYSTVVGPDSLSRNSLLRCAILFTLFLLHTCES